MTTENLNVAANETQPNVLGPNQVVIEKWVYGGEGLARTDKGVVLTPFVLPGEVVQLGRRDKMHAEFDKVITASPDRVTPPCPVFMRCGGCQYQHAPYEFQVARKVEILREQLQRVGKIKFEGEIGVISGPALGYRNRAQFRIVGGKIGYLAAKSHDFVAIEGDCPTLSPRLNQALAEMRDRLRDPRFPKFAQVIEIFTNEEDVQINVTESDKPVARRFYDWCDSKVTVDYATASGTFRVSPKSFFQVNRHLIDQLVEASIGNHSGATAMDLYAGVGLFSVPLARRFANVIAVEAGGAEAHDLAYNARHADPTPREPQSAHEPQSSHEPQPSHEPRPEGSGTDAESSLPIEVVYARVEDFLADHQETPDFVLADPPRAGLGKDVVRDLLRLKPKNITIVSCDPATLARDLATLEGYKIQSLTMVDLFPQTYHMETVAHVTLS